MIKTAACGGVLFSLLDENRNTLLSPAALAAMGRGAQGAEASSILYGALSAASKSSTFCPDSPTFRRALLTAEISPGELDDDSTLKAPELSKGPARKSERGVDHEL